MRTELSIIYTTCRYEPMAEWFLESLQAEGPDGIEVIIIAPQHSNLRRVRPGAVKISEPKPTIWSGPHRITGADWWSAANARNTGICLATRPWIAFVDDRSVLLPGWLDHVREAMRGGYCVAGAYEKVDNLRVSRGVVQGYDSRGSAGTDSRLLYAQQYWQPHGLRPPYECPGEWTYGCALAVPLDWVLEIGGFDETCDGLSGEDYIFGMMLRNCGRPIRYEPRMMLLEDRTPGQCEPAPVRKDKGVSPKDKSHALLEKLRNRKHALLPQDLAEMRRQYQSGRGWQEQLFPARDWYDNSPIAGIT